MPSHNGQFGETLALNFKIFLLLFITFSMNYSLNGVSTTQLLQQQTKRAIRQALLDQNTNDFIKALSSGLNNNLAMTPLGCAVNNAQQRTKQSLGSVFLSYGMTGYPQYPIADSLAVLVDKQAYVNDDLPPFLSIDTTIFKTIQDALNHISYAANAATQIATIFIAEGTYEENIVLPSIRALNIVFIGNVTVGTYSNNKNVTLVFEDESAPTQIINFLPIECINTNTQNFMYPSFFNITGNLLIGNNSTALTTATTKEINLTNLIVKGEAKHGDSKEIGRTYFQLTNCIFEQAFNLYSTNAIGFDLTILVQAFACQFKKFLGIDEYGRILHCKCDDGFRSATPIVSGTRSFYPYVFINSIINGTITGLDTGSSLTIYLDQNSVNNSNYSLSNATATIVESSE